MLRLLALREGRTVSVRFVMKIIPVLNNQKKQDYVLNKLLEKLGDRKTQEAYFGYKGINECQKKFRFYLLERFLSHSSNHK